MPYTKDKMKVNKMTNLIKAIGVVGLAFLIITTSTCPAEHVKEHTGFGHSFHSSPIWLA
jgi:hypothetical protein